MYKSCSSSLYNFLHLPVTPDFFGQNIFLSPLFSNTLSLCSSFNVKDQVSHPHKTTSKIILLYMLIFTFFNRRFWTEWQQALPEFNLLLIPSCIEFRFVIVVPKHLDCDTFPNDPFHIVIFGFWSAFWSRDTNIYLVFSTVTSSPTSLLASIKVSVFYL
jgi:hypothetical protein